MSGKRSLILVLTGLIVLAGIIFSVWHGRRTQTKNDARQAQSRLARGRELVKAAPKPGTPEWFKWYQSLSREDALSWALAADEAAKPPEASQEQKRAALVTTSPPSATGLFKGTMLLNYKPLLRMEERVSIRPLQMDTVRGPNGLETTMWARRAASAIKVEWAAGRVTKVKEDNVKEATGPSPHWMEEDILFGAEPDFVGYSDHKTGTGFKRDWPRGTYANPFIASRSYRYLFGRESRELSGPITAVVVVDKELKALADVIPVPTGTDNVYCVFDLSKQYLALLDSGWQWIMMFDLKPLAERDRAAAGPEPAK